MTRSGRPPKAPEDRRSESLRTRVTASERRRIEEAAREQGISVSDYLRRAALEAT